MRRIANVVLKSIDNGGPYLDSSFDGGRTVKALTDFSSTRGSRSFGVRRGVLATVVSALLAGVVADAAGVRFYRYTNAQGATEISSSIPSDRVKHGYQIIDGTSGRVLQTIDPQLSDEAARRKAAQDAKMADCKAAVRRVRALYQSEAEIFAAETQALESIDTRIVNARANITQLETQLAELEQRAARIERSGQALGVELLSSIESAREQITRLEEEVATRRAEQDTARGEYAAERALFANPRCEELITSAR